MKLLKAVKNFLIDWVWQLPQNILGLGYHLVIQDDIIREFDSDISNCLVCVKRSNGAVTLGKYVFVYNGYNDLSGVVKHELGHVKQSRILGSLYLFVIGIPSIIWAGIHKYVSPNKSYYWFYTESWANKLAGISNN